VVAQSIASINSMGISMTVIVGGGNIFRANQGPSLRLSPDQADDLGMYATGFNAQMLAFNLSNMGVPVQIFSRGVAGGLGISYDIPELRSVISNGQVAIIAGGSGKRGTSTDVPAVQAAYDTGADVVIMAKNRVDGVYAADPQDYPDAKFLPELTASEALEMKLRVMDRGAMKLARSCNKLIHVVGAKDPNSIRYAIAGEEIGSRIHPR
jgi:uridylate kinase